MSNSSGVKMSSMGTSSIGRRPNSRPFVTQSTRPSPFVEASARLTPPKPVSALPAPAPSKLSNARSPETTALGSKHSWVGARDGTGHRDVSSGGLASTFMRRATLDLAAAREDVPSGDTSFPALREASEAVPRSSEHLGKNAVTKWGTTPAEVAPSNAAHVMRQDTGVSPIVTTSLTAALSYSLPNGPVITARSADEARALQPKTTCNPWEFHKAESRDVSEYDRRGTGNQAGQQSASHVAFPGLDESIDLLTRHEKEDFASRRGRPGTSSRRDIFNEGEPPLHNAFFEIHKNSWGGINESRGKFKRDFESGAASQHRQSFGIDEGSSIHEDKGSVMAQFATFRPLSQQEFSPLKPFGTLERAPSPSPSRSKFTSQDHVHRGNESIMRQQKDASSNNESPNRGKGFNRSSRFGFVDDRMDTTDAHNWRHHSSKSPSPKPGRYIPSLHTSKAAEDQAVINAKNERFQMVNSDVEKNFSLMDASPPCTSQLHGEEEKIWHFDASECLEGVLIDESADLAVESFDNKERGQNVYEANEESNWRIRSTNQSLSISDFSSNENEEHFGAPPSSQVVCSNTTVPNELPSFKPAALVDKKRTLVPFQEIPSDANLESILQLPPSTVSVTSGETPSTKISAPAAPSASWRSRTSNGQQAPTAGGLDQLDHDTGSSARHASPGFALKSAGMSYEFQGRRFKPPASSLETPIASPLPLKKNFHRCETIRLSRSPLAASLNEGEEFGRGGLQPTHMEHTEADSKQPVSQKDDGSNDEHTSESADLPLKLRRSFFNDTTNEGMAWVYQHIRGPCMSKKTPEAVLTREPELQLPLPKAACHKLEPLLGEKPLLLSYHKETQTSLCESSMLLKTKSFTMEPGNAISSHWKLSGIPDSLGVPSAHPIPSTTAPSIEPVAGARGAASPLNQATAALPTKSCCYKDEELREESQSSGLAPSEHYDDQISSANLFAPHQHSYAIGPPIPTSSTYIFNSIFAGATNNHIPSNPVDHLSCSSSIYDADGARAARQDSILASRTQREVTGFPGFVPIDSQVTNYSSQSALDSNYRPVTSQFAAHFRHGSAGPPISGGIMHVGQRGRTHLPGRSGEVTHEIAAIWDRGSKGLIDPLTGQANPTDQAVLSKPQTFSPEDHDYTANMRNGRGQFLRMADPHEAEANPQELYRNPREREANSSCPLLASNASPSPEMFVTSEPTPDMTKLAGQSEQVLGSGVFCPTLRADPQMSVEIREASVHNYPNFVPSLSRPTQNNSTECSAVGLPRSHIVASPSFRPEKEKSAREETNESVPYNSVSNLESFQTSHPRYLSYHNHSQAISYNPSVYPIVRLQHEDAEGELGRVVGSDKGRDRRTDVSSHGDYGAWQQSHLLHNSHSQQHDGINLQHPPLTEIPFRRVQCYTSNYPASRNSLRHPSQFEASMMAKPSQIRTCNTEPPTQYVTNGLTSAPSAQIHFKHSNSMVNVSFSTSGSNYTSEQQQHSSAPDQ